MKRTVLYPVGFLALVAALIGLMMAVLNNRTQSPSGAILLERTFQSNAFEIAYPSEWTYQIPQVNMMFLASPAILEQQAGATMTLQRVVSLPDTTLEEAMGIYLERGPLRSDRWQITQGIDTTNLAGLDALYATVQGAETETALLMRADIYLLRAENGFDFIITATAPLDEWEQSSPTLNAMLQSITIIDK